MPIKLTLLLASFIALYLAHDIKPLKNELPLVQTKDGPVQGFIDNNAAAPYAFYYGIPFAKPPLDTLRFMPPENPDRWTTPIMASTFKPQCAQNERVPEKVYDEDCLYLNVFTPSLPQEDLPVLVFIHGGSFLHGGTSDYPSGQLSVFTNSVIVTIAYRVDIFGFYFNEDNKQYENVGLHDQALGIQWVYDNIKAFGGDPSSLTIFGESAGGMSVLMQGLIPTASPISNSIKAVIAESPAPWKMPSISDTNELSSAIGEYLHCPGDVTRCLQDVPASVILAALDSLNIKFYPSVGGKSLPKQPLELFITGEYKKLPLIIGTNEYEGNLFVAPKYGPPSKPMDKKTYEAAVNDSFPDFSAELIVKIKSWYAKYAEQRGYWEAASKIFADAFISCGGHLASKKISTFQPNTHWRYFFTKISDNPYAFLNATHTSELPYVFQQPHLFFNGSFTSEDVVVEHAMGTYWKSMSVSGKPLGSESWLLASKDQMLEFNYPIKMVPLDFEDWSYCDNWQPILTAME